MSPEDLQSFRLTLKLALVSTTILLVIGTPLAWWIARSKRRILRTLVDAAVSLPLVMPPSVLGFYLLVALGANSPLAGLFERMGLRTLAFTFPGLVIGVFIHSLPVVVRPLQAGFSAIDERVFEAAATLRANRWDRFFTIALPQAKAGFFAAAVLGCAHSIGAFGVVLMIGGNIPGKTRVLSIAIYEHVEMLEYHQAHLLAGILLGLSFVFLVAVQVVSRRIGAKAAVL